MTKRMNHIIKTRKGLIDQKIKGLRVFSSFYLFIFCLIFLSFNKNASAQVRLEADTIALGDQTVLTINNAAQYPSTDMLSTGGIVALGQEFDTTGRVQRTLITCFEPGEHWIHISENDSLPLYVNDVAIDTASMEPRDIAPLVKVPYTFWELFRWVLLVWAVAALVIVLWWLRDRRLRKKQNGGAVESRKPIDTRPPDVRALEEMEQLRRKGLWQAGKAKEYHTELTDIVRRFIEETTGIRATEMTSEETIEAVRSAESSEFGVRSSELKLPHPDSSELRTPSSKLSTMFATADLVKFAKSEPLPHEHDRSMQLAEEFVRALWQMTKPAEEKEAADE